MNQNPNQRWNEGWPDHFAWSSFAGGIVGMLLVGLLLWVDAIDSPDGAVSAAGPDTETVSVIVERVRIERRDGDRVEIRSLPLAAVLRDDALDPYCFVIEGGGQRALATRRPLVLGEVVRDRVQIQGGLRGGDRVLVRGQHAVFAGDLVRVVSE